MKAIQTAFPNIITSYDYNKPNTILLELDLKPRPNVKGMPKFERRIWFAELTITDTINLLLYRSTTSYDKFGTISYDIQDPQSLNKIYSLLHKHYEDAKEILKKYDITMITEMNEPTDLELEKELQATAITILISNTKIPLLEWNLNARNA